MLSERNILIWLNNIGISSLTINNLKENFVDLTELWYAKEQTLRNIGVLKEDTIKRIINHRNIELLEDLLIKLENNNVNTLTIYDEDYPISLTNIYNKPAVLYTKGNYKLDRDLAIGIVGSRKATSYGKWACEKFVKELVNLGVTIISGLAMGIDSIAHRTAVEYGGKTIGILGNGIDKVYPRVNARLYDDVSNNGIILTEFPMGTEPLSYNFPQRNRIIAGLSQGIVVIEAKEKSGSLITAHHSLEQGKDVFAVPGNINSLYSTGTNKLIKDGAKPLLSIDDIIEEIYELQIRTIEKKADGHDFTNLSEDEAKIMRIILEGPVHTDIISLKSGMDISNVISILTILELKGFIKELSGRTFTVC
ncbi:DNA-processing protein DprA [Tissierella sp. Yu-01]|uniref:DNA-processing protein DprA n=1 Tax=Tissierella sp. Yu-01 TaxID=3035694 RepID=UPI00240E0BE7|nr:DNA-processing protein DprA [Tissierella sp. Yu-01]WFA09776.1 DNA-processing protein DprA [Tissierella sp. Yu-01]